MAAAEADQYALVAKGPAFCNSSGEEA